MPQKSREQNHDNGKNFSTDVCSALKQAYLDASTSLRALSITSLSLWTHRSNIQPFLLTKKTES